MRLNVRRGLFRLWLLSTVLWILGACYVGYTEYRAYQNQWHAPVADIMVPTDCSKARGDEGNDFDRRDGHCWYTLPKLRASFTEYRISATTKSPNACMSKPVLAGKITREGRKPLRHRSGAWASRWRCSFSDGASSGPSRDFGPLLFRQRNRQIGYSGFGGATR